MIDRKGLMIDIRTAFPDPDECYVLQRIVNQFANEIDQLQGQAELEPEEPLPPVGMAIEAIPLDIACDWEPADVQEDLHGNPVVRVNGRMYNIREVKWRYKRAPKRWPEVTKSWLALSTGEYIYSRYLGWRDGQMINVDGIDRIATILHVEHRPEETSDD